MRGVCTHFSGISGRVHNGHPTFESGHLKKAEISLTNIVPVHLGVDPVETGVEALHLVVNKSGIHHVTIPVFALLPQQGETK